MCVVNSAVLELTGHPVGHAGAGGRRGGTRAGRHVHRPAAGAGAGPGQGPRLPVPGGHPGGGDRQRVRPVPVNRRTQSGAPFAPEEAVSPLQALRAYTLGAAYAGFEEHKKGSITPGKLADLAVLSADPTTTDPEGIRDIDVLQTYVGGVPTP
ncbi:MAG: amidohydrolase family protein [Streptosporangiales bacterium]|nr:amidohydrolase family protein [Streptosporangiales bacterium]